MPTVEAATMGVHIAAGFVALFAGLGALATEKGGRRHRRFGRTFVYAMAVVSGSALALYALSPVFVRLLLGLVAVFSFYFAFSGYRVLSRKRPQDDPDPVDWLAVALLAGVSVALLGAGVDLHLRGVGLGTVVLVFGGIGVLFGVNDVQSLRHGPEPDDWLANHVTRMGAGYIAAVSAFSAVNFQFLPFALRWLWPTLVGTPLIYHLVRKYEAEFGLA